MDHEVCLTQGSLVIDNATALAAYVILFYDYFITLSEEIDRFWLPRSHNWASRLFLATRYGAVLGHVPLFYYSLKDPCNTSSIAVPLSTYHGGLMLLLHFMSTVLLVMRVYALYMRNKWVLGILVFEITAAEALGCWVVIRLIPGGTITTASRELTHMQAVAFSGLLVTDTTVLALTVYRSIRLWTRKEPFLHRLLVDGLLYYGVIWNLNLANILVLLFVNPGYNLATPIFTNVLSVVLVSRLMLNLRDPKLCKTIETDKPCATSYAVYLSTVWQEDTMLTGTTHDGSRC